MLTNFYVPSQISCGQPVQAEISYAAQNDDCIIRFSTSDAQCNITPSSISASKGIHSLTVDLTVNCTTPGSRVLVVTAAMVCGGAQVNKIIKNVHLQC